MDIIKFDKDVSNPGLIRNAEVVNGLKTKTWIERYQDPGEFTFTAPLSSNMRELLPLYSVVSHVNSTDLMVVESHEINDNGGGDEVITISGRSYETAMEGTIIGTNGLTAATEEVYDENANDYYSFSLISIGGLSFRRYPMHDIFHRACEDSSDDDDNINYMNICVPFYQFGDHGTLDYQYSTSWYLKYGNGYERLLDYAKQDNCGVKIWRPGKTPPGFDSSETYNTYNAYDVLLYCDMGRDLSDSVIFDYELNDISSANYLWSSKSLFNAVLVKGTWRDLYYKSDLDSSYLNRKILYLEAKDVDKDYTSSEVNTPGTEQDEVDDEFLARAKQLLQPKSELSIAKIEAHNSDNQLYRDDYIVGDLVRVGGAYGESEVLRVTEYVEIEDERGEIGYPTFDKPNDRLHGYV